MHHQHRMHKMIYAIMLLHMQHLIIDDAYDVDDAYAIGYTHICHDDGIYDKMLHTPYDGMLAESSLYHDDGICSILSYDI